MRLLLANTPLVRLIQRPEFTSDRLKQKRRHWRRFLNFLGLPQALKGQSITHLQQAALPDRQLPLTSATLMVQPAWL